MKFTDENGLLYVWQKIKTKLAEKVDKVTGKDLSTNDYTNEDKTKLIGIEEGAEVNKIDTIKVNEIIQTITDKSVDITVPTDNNQLTNGAGYQTASDVSTAITNALKDITSISYSVVTELPATGETGVIYLLANSSNETSNVYDEYIYINSSFEKIGTTEMDLSGYLQSTDLVAITNAEIDAIFTE